MFGDLDWPLNASGGLSAIAQFVKRIVPYDVPDLGQIDGNAIR